MTLQEIQEEIISEFDVFDDWMDKYEYIIDLGKELPIIDPLKKTDDRLIEGDSFLHATKLSTFWHKKKGKFSFPLFN